MNAHTSTYPPLVDSRGALDIGAFLAELDELSRDRPASRPYWTRILLLEVAEQQWPFVQQHIQWTPEEADTWEWAIEFAHECGSTRAAERHYARAHAIYLQVRNRAQAAFYASLKKKEPNHV